MSKDRGENIYCNNPFQPSRLKTREVFIGNVPMGSMHPVRIQSMTNTPTGDTIASVEQCIRIIEKGADYVRLTAANIQEAENLANIKKELRTKGYSTPLIADVHFNPRVAETSARIVEKIRINPGNFVSSHDKGKPSIREKLVPLINICKEYGTAMRIGVNHGSLSKRILQEYGDTPTGMVESAMEYLEICREENFHQLIFSMKSSNTLVMVQAYRLLVSKMLQLGDVYPLHLGVTEAGDGEDGRIKSAVGIGTLMADGLGDTIRVSLTEDPEEEIPVGQKLVAYYDYNNSANKVDNKIDFPVDPFQYNKRKTHEVENIGGNKVPVVIINLESVLEIDWSDLGFNYNSISDTWHKSDASPDYLFFGSSPPPEHLPSCSIGLVNIDLWGSQAKYREQFYPVFTIEEFKGIEDKSSVLNFIKVSSKSELSQFLRENIENKTIVLILNSKQLYALHEYRAVFSELIHKGSQIPVILTQDSRLSDSEEQMLVSAFTLGGLSLDGLGDGIWIEKTNKTEVSSTISLAFGILQASRVRTSKTEYISCPSCGRTLFDILEITAKIKQKTRHLKGLKIGIMGCIVNGPGEMADADYGYVGSGKGKISLYKNKNVVKKSIPAEVAVEELIQLIKENGDWVEPVQ